MENENKINSNSIAISIVIAGIIIAGAIFITKDSGGSVVVNNPSDNTGTVNLNDFRKLQKDDHVKGNRNAKVTMVEFSDFECPFCARIHPSLSRILEERDDVNWVYRHFPLSSIHSRALGSAIASECIADLAGNDAFWQFVDNVFSEENQLGTVFYNSQAENFGINISDFETCINSKEISDKVTEDLNEVIVSGGTGTPYVVIITASGDLRPFSGALPYESILALIDEALVN
jgi:protein-disulfide isomerase